MRWLRRLLKRYMKPVHELDAVKWKMRLSFVYAFVAWNALGVVAYQVYNKKNDWASFYGLKLEEEKNVRPGVYWAETLGMKKATIVRIDGLEVVDKFEYEPSEE